MDYAICEISGKQYLVKPGQVLEVDKLTEEKNLTVEKVLLMVKDGKTEVGAPYLKTPLQFEVLATIKAPKVRVAKFHAKANYRRVTGQRAQKTQIRLVDKKSGK